MIGNLIFQENDVIFPKCELCPGRLREEWANAQGGYEGGEKPKLPFLCVCNRLQKGCSHWNRPVFGGDLSLFGIWHYFECIALLEQRDCTGIVEHCLSRALALPRA